MRSIQRCIWVILCLVVAAQGPAVHAAPVERLAIVDQAIAHHGGDIYRSSDTSLEVCSKSGCFGVEAHVDGDQFVYEISGTIRKQQRRVRATNSEVQWWDANGEPLELSPEDQSGLRNFVMARVYFPFLPYRLNDPSVYKTDLGLETWGDRPLHKVKITFTPGSSTDADDEYLYWFDPQSGQVEQFAYSYAGDPGGLRFRRAFNFRRIGGILFFDAENLGVEGEDLSVDLIDPAFVETMRQVSVVEVKNIRVRSLS